MTDVLFDYRQPGETGVLAAAGGYVNLQPSTRVVADEITGHPVILPEPFAVELVDGQATIDLRPTGTSWYWIITAPDQHVRNVAVPVDAGTLNAADLTDIDPDTLDPAAEPAAAWQAALNNALDRITALEEGVAPGGWTAVDASTTVKGIVELATNAEAQAGTDTTRAVTPAALAAVVGTLGSLNGLGAAIWSSSTGWPARPTCTICFWIGTQSASAGYPSEATDYDVVFQHPDAP